MTDYLGWVATAVFVGSYFFKRPQTLRRVQMLGAVLWMVYGLLMRAPPVVVANVLVLAAALWTGRRAATETTVEAPAQMPAHVSVQVLAQSPANLPFSAPIKT